MGKHISTIIFTLLIIIVGCAGHSKESDKSFSDSLVSDKGSGFTFDTIIETGSSRIYDEQTSFDEQTLIYFISKSKTKIPGYLVSITDMFKPENYWQDNLQSLDTLEKQHSLIDIYAIQGDKTRCLAYIDNITPPSIVMSVKNGEILSPQDLGTSINSFFNVYGLKKGDSILDPVVFFKEADKAFDLAAKSTRNNLEKMFGSVKCRSYDLPSDKGVYENNDTTLVQLRQQIARQEYIDSVAELANYSEPHKYAQVVASFLKADPETIGFVSEYLTDKKRLTQD